MNQTERTASLWVGTAVSDRSLQEYLAFSYSADGDVIPGGFARDFRIEWFDEDYMEAAAKERHSQSLRTLLARHSDGEEVTSAFEKLIGDKLASAANAVVLLYQFAYHGTVKSVDSGPVRLRFIGTVSY